MKRLKPLKMESKEPQPKKQRRKNEFPDEGCASRWMVCAMLRDWRCFRWAVAHTNI